MKTRHWFGLVLATWACCSMGVAEANGPLRRAAAESVPWHGAYYDPAWGVPHALVVPPTACKQTKYSWGVTNFEVQPIKHQFRRQYPGPYYGESGYGFLPTPLWPGHTDQFGVYYIRGPRR